MRIVMGVLILNSNATTLEIVMHLNNTVYYTCFKNIKH